ncbi:MAG: hypothetical protein ACK4N5_19485, partial [Myxococcales bacterium]
MRLFVLLLVTLVAVAAVPRPVHAFEPSAQDASGELPPPPPSLPTTPATVTQERQIPFDAEGRVETIDRALAQRLELFPEHGSLERARLFETPAGYVLELSEGPEGKLSRSRRLLSEEQMLALRDDVATRIARLAPGTTLNQEGRVVLLVATTVLGLGLYGWAVPVGLDVGDARLAVGSYMLTAGASFFVPWLLTANREVTWGQTSLAIFGGTRGIVHGHLAGLLIANDVPDRWPLVTMLFSIAELTGGYFWARATDMDAGTAHVVENGGDAGLGVALGVGGASGLLDRAQGPRLAGALGLAGTAAGIAGGRVLAIFRD